MIRLNYNCIYKYIIINIINFKLCFTIVIFNKLTQNVLIIKKMFYKKIIKIYYFSCELWTKHPKNLKN